MDIQVSKQQLLKVLNRTHGVADRKSSIPVLSNILASADKDGSIKLSATDLYVSVVGTVQAEVAQPGAAAIPGRMLFDIVKNLNEGVVHIKLRDNKQIEIRSGKSNFKLPVLASEDFPELPKKSKDASSWQLPVQALSDLITRTSYAMSSDEARPHLCGTLLEVDDKSLRMVSTDGHRLSKAEVTLSDPSKKGTVSMLVPGRGVHELKRLLDDGKVDAEANVEISYSAGYVFVRRDGFQLSIKLSEEQFPPYSKVIPGSRGKEVLVSRHAFQDAIRRMMLVSSDRSGIVRLHLATGVLKISAESPELGEGSEEIDVNHTREPVDIGFNAKYLLDILSNLVDDEVLFEVNGALEPGTIVPASPGAQSFVGVVMPVRI